MTALLVLLAALLPALGAAQTASGEEALRYTINWPSGLSLGEAEITRRPVDGGFELRMSVQAALPGFAVGDHYVSRVNEQGCSLEFTKQSTHGKRKAHEKSTFDLAAGVLIRQTLPEGGSSRLPVPDCPHDALAFLFFLRAELAGGRLPGPRTVYFGAPYEVQLAYGGTHVEEETGTVSDRVTGTIKGPASDNRFEAHFSRDGARTPIRVTVPLPPGSFTMELAP